MTIGNPISVAASAPTPALSFTRVKQDGYGSEGLDATNGYEIFISHSNPASSGERHYLKITQTKDAVNPYTGGTSKQTASVSISANFPAFGWDASTKAALVKALTDTLADADVTVANWLAFQSQ